MLIIIISIEQILLHSLKNWKRLAISASFNFLDIHCFCFKKKLASRFKPEAYFETFMDVLLLYHTFYAVLL